MIGVPGGTFSFTHAAVCRARGLSQCSWLIVDASNACCWSPKRCDSSITNQPNAASTRTAATAPLTVVERLSLVSSASQRAKSNAERPSAR